MVRAALEGLAGVTKIEVDLERDSFTVHYDGESLDPERIERKIESLGFRARPVVVVRDSRGTRGPVSPDKIPEPIAGAIAEARSSGRLVVVDYHADWCAPCQVLEEEVIPSPVVQRALRDFIVIKVDGDRFPEAVRLYDIAVMPTLLILDAQGTELDRITGTIEREPLAERLEKLAERAGTSPGASPGTPGRPARRKAPGG